MEVIGKYLNLVIEYNAENGVISFRGRNFYPGCDEFEVWAGEENDIEVPSKCRILVNGHGFYTKRGRRCQCMQGRNQPAEPKPKAEGEAEERCLPYHGTEMSAIEWAKFLFPKGTVVFIEYGGTSVKAEMHYKNGIRHDRRDVRNGRITFCCARGNLTFRTTAVLKLKTNHVADGGDVTLRYLNDGSRPGKNPRDGTVLPAQMWANWRFAGDGRMVSIKGWTAKFDGFHLASTASNGRVFFSLVEGELDFEAEQPLRLNDDGCDMKLVPVKSGHGMEFI
jgi:hypothetical protein